jgi:C4-dicarboxylate transporter, DctM subunit
MKILPFIIFIITMLMGLPISFSLATAGIIGVWIVTGSWNAAIGILGTTPFASVSEYVLTTIPMFILMAHLTSSSGLAEDLYNSGAKWMSSVRGGLAIATIIATMIFGAMSGASVAAAAVMSKICIPNMKRFGYSDVLSAGVVGVGATTDILIPPSVALIVYGVMTGTSIGRLLIAGIIPGILVCILLACCVLVWVKIFPSHAPMTPSSTWKEKWNCLIALVPVLIFIALLLVLLYTGIATPTEVGALGVVLATIIGLCMKRLDWSGSKSAFIETIKSSGMIFMIFMGANIFGNFIVISQVPQELMAYISTLNLNRWTILIGIIISYFIISMFMDELPLLIITLMLTFPIIESLGFDTIWFGILCMLMMSMGLVFPPVGLAAYVVSGVSHIPLEKVFKGTSIMMTAIVLATILILIFPEIAIWLPSKMNE